MFIASTCTFFIDFSLKDASLIVVNAEKASEYHTSTYPDLHTTYFNSDTVNAPESYPSHTSKPLNAHALLFSESRRCTLVLTCCDLTGMNGLQTLAKLFRDELLPPH